jgi:hypothetical protein
VRVRSAGSYCRSIPATVVFANGGASWLRKITMRTVIVSAHSIGELEFDIVLDGPLAIEPTFNQPLMAANDNLVWPFIPFPEDWSDCIVRPAWSGTAGTFPTLPTPIV